MKKLVVILLVLIIGVTLFAQDDVTPKWKNGGTGGLQFSQAALKNWMAGGENAMALNLSFKYFMDYQYEKMTWKNNLDVAYGIQIIAGESKKTDDKIDFASSFGYEAKTSGIIQLSIVLKHKWFRVTPIRLRYPHLWHRHI